MVMLLLVLRASPGILSVRGVGLSANGGSPGEKCYQPFEGLKVRRNPIIATLKYGNIVENAPQWGLGKNWQHQADWSSYADYFLFFLQHPVVLDREQP